jgi:hypothetical protein
MTTITFEENIKINKYKFKNISDFREYLENNSYIIELKKMKNSEITPRIIKKMKETKKLSRLEFANI